VALDAEGPELREKHPADSQLTEQHPMADSAAHERTTQTRPAPVAEEECLPRVVSAELDAERRVVQALRDQVSRLEVELQELQTGLAFRLLARYRFTLERILPHGSLRRRIYDGAVRSLGLVLLGHRRSDVAGPVAVRTESTVESVPARPGFPLPRSDLFKKINKSVHPQDEMFATAKLSMPQPGHAYAYYFYSADFLIQNLLRFLEGENINVSECSLLDYAAGYGRLTRSFIHLFREVEVADVEADMLKWQRDQFGVKGYLVPVILGHGLPIPRQYDVVFCFSLFTHLHPDIWQDWFKALVALARPGGLLIISIGSPDLDKFLTGQEHTEEIDFRPQNETGGRLNADIYGKTTVSHAYIVRFVATLQNVALLRRFGRHECDLYHDIYVFQIA
jgi:SAM-dependent methyltransferase